MILLAAGIMLAFSLVSGIVARQIAVKWAQSRGYTAMTMPVGYYLWFVSIHGVVNVLVWVGLYYWLVT